MTDPIADMLSRIKNAITRRQESVDLPFSRLKEEIARLLREEGYISRAEVLSRRGKKALRVTLKYSPTGKSVIAGLRRISRPGLRAYSGWRNIPQVQDGFGTAIVSTPGGVLSGDAARQKKVGGEILCYIW